MENATESPLDNSSKSALDKWQTFGTYRWRVKYWWNMSLKIHDDFWGVGLWCAILPPHTRYLKGTALRSRREACLWNWMAALLQSEGVDRWTEGADRGIMLIYGSGILRLIGDFPESLSQAMLVGTMLVGRLGVGGLIRKRTSDSGRPDGAQGQKIHPQTPWVSSIGGSPLSGGFSPCR